MLNFCVSYFATQHSHTAPKKKRENYFVSLHLHVSFVHLDTFDFLLFSALVRLVLAEWLNKRLTLNKIPFQEEFPCYFLARRS